MCNADITRLLQEEAALGEEEGHVERSYVRPRAPESQVYSLRIPAERLEAWPGDPRLLERLLGRAASLATTRPTGLDSRSAETTVGGN